MEKVKKVRTSITIDPEVLAKARHLVEEPGGDHRSVAALVEKALVKYLEEHAPFRVE